MDAFDPAAVLRAAVTNSYEKLTNDLRALPEDKAAIPYADASRSAVEIVTECAAVNGMFVEFLTTGAISRPIPEQRAAFFASVTTRQQALDLLEQNTRKLLAAVEAFDPARWGEPVDGYTGRFDTIFGGVEFAALHMMYHDGQLNFLHALHGDSAMHW